MSGGDVTIGFLKRLEDLLAGQYKWDVDITGGTIENVVLINVTSIGGNIITDDDLNPTVGVIPERSLTGFNDTPLTVVRDGEGKATGLISTVTIQVPGESFEIGVNVTATDIAGFLSVIAQAFEGDQTFFTQNSLFKTQEEYDNAVHGDGIIHPARFNMLPQRWQDTIPFEFQVLSGNKTTFAYVTETNLIVNTIKLRLDDSVGNVRLVIERLQDDFVTWKPVWENVQDVPDQGWTGGYDLVAGENTVPLPSVNLGRSGEIFRATFETEEAELPLKGVETDLGLGLAFYPFLMIEAQDWFFTDVPNDYDVTQDNSGKFAKETVFNTSSDIVRRVEGDEADGSDEQLDDTETKPAERDLGFEFTNIDAEGRDVTFQSLTFQSLTAHTGCLCTIDGTGLTGNEFEPIFNTIDVVVGFNTITFPQQAILKDGQEYNVSIFAFDGNNDMDAGISVKRETGGAGRPYFTYKIKPLTEEDLVEEAPEDTKLYGRKDGEWVETNALDTTYDNTDADIEAETVKGALDELSLYPRGVVCMEGNTTDTVISVIDTFVKVAGTLSAALGNRQFSLGTDSLVCDVEKQRVYDIDVVFDMTKQSGSGGVDTYVLQIYKNGVAAGCGSIVGATETFDTMIGIITAPVELVDTDYVEVYIKNITGTADVLVSTMNIKAR